MKKLLFLCVALIFMATDCYKKDIDVCYSSVVLQLQTDDVFIIGSSGGFSGAGQGTFNIKNGQLFKVLPRGDSLLPNERFLFAQIFVTSFPKEMKDLPNQNWKSQCNDTFLYYVEWTQANGTKQSWHYDSCPSQSAPEYAKCYFEKVIKGLFTP
jgi:hypothetical protein